MIAYVHNVHNLLCMIYTSVYCRLLYCSEMLCNSWGEVINNYSLNILFSASREINFDFYDVLFLPFTLNIHFLFLKDLSIFHF